MVPTAASSAITLSADSATALQRSSGRDHIVSRRTAEFSAAIRLYLLKKRAGKICCSGRAQKSGGKCCVGAKKDRLFFSYSCLMQICNSSKENPFFRFLCIRTSQIFLFKQPMRASFHNSIIFQTSFYAGNWISKNCSIIVSVLICASIWTDNRIFWFIVQSNKRW